VPAIVELTLDPAPVSVRTARRAVEDALRGEGAADELVDSAVLLVSEVVSNAVLHAGTVLRFRCEAGPLGVRVEVADESPVAPTERTPTEREATGRGLMLVRALASDFGVQMLSAGKVVWFAVGDYAGATAEDEVIAPATYTVRFLDVPVPIARAALDYGEAVLRELALLTLSGSTDGEEHWHAPRFNLGPLLDALDSAADAGEAVVTIDVEFPVDAKDLSLERLSLVEEGHQLAREGKLIATPAIPEVMHCRRWVYRQIHQQADGAQPECWELPEDSSEVDVALDARDRAVLDDDAAVVAGDDHNRIVFVNAAAEELLGVDAGVLVGRRLTAIIPAEWQVAHLAGFARFQLTGDSRIIGNSVTVPALRGDGTTVRVELLIEPVTVSRGRVFRAILERADTAPGQGALMS
jgi:PAS domain S-box-containing protein